MNPRDGDSRNLSYERWELAGLVAGWSQNSLEPPPAKRRWGRCSSVGGAEIRSRSHDGLQSARSKKSARHSPSSGPVTRPRPIYPSCSDRAAVGHIGLSACEVWQGSTSWTLPCSPQSSQLPLLCWPLAPLTRQVASRVAAPTAELSMRYAGNTNEMPTLGSPPQSGTTQTKPRSGPARTLPGVRSDRACSRRRMMPVVNGFTGEHHRSELLSLSSRSVPRPLS